MLPIIKNSIKEKNPSVKIFPEFQFRMNFDGCSKGNPGLAGAGAVIYLNNSEIWCDHIFVGEKATNNYAEYSGLLLGLEKALELDVNTLLVQGDSQLVINQMSGDYNCNSPNLIELHNKSKDLAKKFDKIFFQHIPRNLNKRADALSNNGIINNK
jgi:ribonuclease HI